MRRQQQVFFDAGCDHVLGHGTHWSGPIEITPTDDGDHRVTMVSHGNFLFGQEWSQQTQEGVLLELAFRGTELDVDANPVSAGRFGVRAIPTMIVFKDGREAQRLLGWEPTETHTYLHDDADKVVGLTVARELFPPPDATNTGSISGHSSAAPAISMIYTMKSATLSSREPWTLAWP